MNEYDHLFKIVFTGIKGGGKSSLIYSAIVEKFPSRINADNLGGVILFDEREEILNPINGNLGDIPSKIIKIQKQVILLQLWDNYIENLSTTLTNIIFENATVIAICFDLSSSNYKGQIEKYITQFKKSDLTNEIPLVLVGCKNDQAISNFSLNNSLKHFDFIKTSAKTMENVDTLLQLIGNISLNNQTK